MTDGGEHKLCHPGMDKMFLKRDIADYIFECDLSKPCASFPLYRGGSRNEIRLEVRISKDGQIKPELSAWLQITTRK